MSYASNFYNTIDLKNNKNYKYLKLNINNKNKLIKIFKKFKPIGIFNLAAETHVDRSIDSPEQFIDSNILGKTERGKNLEILLHLFNKEEALKYLEAG